jgi:RNA ligase
LISRPFHKFFNLNETEETQSHNFLKLTRTYDALTETKLDGSMVRPVRIDNEIYWITKRGITDTGNLTKDFYENYASDSLKKFVNDMLDANQTPIFEFTDPMNPIVIRYPERNLILLDIRDNLTGRYSNPQNCFSLNYQIERVERHDVNLIEDFDNFVESSRNLKGIEGFIIRLSNGHRMKLKVDEYVLLHKTKENTMSSSKHMVDMYLKNMLDDVFPLLPTHDAMEVEKVVGNFKSSYELKLKKAHALFAEISKIHPDAKSFSINNRDIKGIDLTLMYALYRSQNIKVILDKMIQQKLIQSNKEFEIFLNELGS